MALRCVVVFAFFSISGVAARGVRRLGSTPSVSTVEGDAGKAPIGISLVSRTYVPYDNANAAFGMGACEQISYDADEKYVYAASEKGYVNVIDFGTPSTPQVTSHYLNLTGSTLTDIEVCGGMLFVAMAGSPKTSPGVVKIFDTVKRNVPAAPMLKSTVTVGPLPDMVLPNNACTALAVANEGEGHYASSGGLTDPVGSVSIVTDLFASTPVVTSVSLGSLCADDNACIQLGVHLPLPLKAMEYFDDHSTKFSEDLDFSAARASYTTDTQFEPEYIAWSADDSMIYANLQENSAIVTIDVATATASSIHSYGLKDWSSAGTTDGIDTVKDKDCVLAKKPGFKSMRMPDSIAAFSIGGIGYIVTANEGDDKEYGDFEEKQKFKDVMTSTGSFKSDFAEFVKGTGSGPTDAIANFDGTKMAITIGSSAVDYSNTSSPVFNHAIGFGGRGVSIYTATDMSLVWDSGSDFEREQCKAYPWAHNSIQDEEFAPQTGSGNDLYASLDPTDKLAITIAEMNNPVVDGCSDGGDGAAGACPLSETVDERSLKDGAGPEAVVVGYACGRMLMVTATEKQGTAFVYDVSDPTSPVFLFVHHLSPASESKNPGVAYADGTLGDIDPESTIFVNAAHSPTGKAGVIFGGAWSGTISFYEFDGCSEPVSTPASAPAPAPAPAVAQASENDTNAGHLLAMSWTLLITTIITATFHVRT